MSKFKVGDWVIAGGVRWPGQVIGYRHHKCAEETAIKIAGRHGQHSTLYIHDDYIKMSTKEEVMGELMKSEVWL